MIIMCFRACAKCALSIFLVAIASHASAIPVTGTVTPVTPSGQILALTMTIGDTNTTFELTGPDYSWFAFGFDTTTMFGYSLIVEGLDDDRTVVEQNLLGRGIPGSPQSSQDIDILSIEHHSAVDRTTIVLQRPNQTGDPNDAVFTTSMAGLDLIWAHSSSATSVFPSPNLEYHGFSGRGFARITFSPVPEPASAALLSIAAAMLAAWRPIRV